MPPGFSDLPTALVTGTIGCRRCYRFHSTCMHMYTLLILTYNGANNYLEMPIIHVYVENLAVFHQTCNSSSENVKTGMKSQITNIPH